MSSSPLSWSIKDKFPIIWIKVPTAVMVLGATVLGTNFTKYSASGDHKLVYDIAIDPPLYLKFLIFYYPCFVMYCVIAWLIK